MFSTGLASFINSVNYFICINLISFAQLELELNRANRRRGGKLRAHSAPCRQSREGTGLALGLQCCKERGSIHPDTHLGPLSVQPDLAAAKQPGPGTITSSWVSLLTFHRGPEAPTTAVVHPHSLQDFYIKSLISCPTRANSWFALSQLKPAFSGKKQQAGLNSCHQLSNTLWGTPRALRVLESNKADFFPLKKACKS